MTRRISLPPQEYLAKAVRFDARTGRLYWRRRPPSQFKASKQSPELKAHNWNALFAGKFAFDSVTTAGYRKGGLSGSTYLAHRIIWKLIYGTDPLEIDHVDGDRANNILANLRSVTCSENNQNRRLPETNTSGVMGVCWASSAGAWKAYIRYHGKRVHLGYFSDFDAAVLARRVAERRFGYHPNHGRPATTEVRAA